MTVNYASDRFPGPDPYAPLADVPTFDIASEDIVDGERLADALAGDNATSPQLSWSGAPEGTKTYAVTCFDPDAPTASGFWHWSAFNIPADVTELPAGAGAKDDLGVGAIVLTGDSGVKGYYGANPPAGHGPHRYLFAVHAVGEELDIDDRQTPTVLGFNLNFKATARGILWGWAEN